MQYQIFLVGIICIICMPSRSSANNKCFIAKTCVHDAKEKCGENRMGELRRFLDTCDMKEYNCLKKTDYIKVPLEFCQDLPPIDEKSPEKDKEVVQEDPHVEPAEEEIKPQDEIKEDKEKEDPHVEPAEEETKAQDEIKDKKEYKEQEDPDVEPAEEETKPEMK